MSGYLDGSVIDAIQASHGRAVDLETILERVDASEKTLLTFDELTGGLQRASDAGEIREVGGGRYVDARRTERGGPVSDLRPDAYAAAVRRYQTSFTRNLVQVNSSLPMRGLSGLFEAVYRLSGGRLGLQPGMVDLDGVSLTFLLANELEPIGWTCEIAHRTNGVRRIEVQPLQGLTSAAERERVVAIVAGVVQGDEQFTGPHLVVFPDGEDVKIADEAPGPRARG